MQVAIGFVLTVFFARFWTSHLGNLPLVLSGITLHAYSVALIISGVTELLLVIRTDYAAQVVTIQKYVTLLRQWRVRSRRWFGLAQWLLWVPVMLGLLAWLVGFDLGRSEGHTSELQSLMRILDAGFFFKKKNK